MAENEYTVASDSEIGEEKPSPSFLEPAIGIDFGTSQSSVGIWNGTHVELLRNARNQNLIRSYVIFKDDVPTGGVSDTTHDELQILSGRAIFNIKRLVGRVDTDPVVHSSKTLPFLIQTLNIGVRPFVATLVNNVWRSTTPEEALAIFLVELRAMAEIQLKQPIRNVVLTIPVSFSRFQQTRILRACAMAGLHVLRLMPEPTAVALLYAQHQQQTVHENMGSGTEKIALIFNMGAGFCDVAITATAGGVSQIKALSGAAIGGEDILQNVMHHLVPGLDALSSSHGASEIKSMALLRVSTKEAIQSLSSKATVLIDVDLGNGLKVSKFLGRGEFEEINILVFEKCKSLIIQCLYDAKLDVEDLTDVILVGGCSNIPKIRSLVLELCKREKLYEGMDLLEAAVCGATLEAAVTSGITDPTGNLDLLTIQATPLSLGIRADGDFVPIIHRNTTVPARKDMIFTTTRDNQTEALIVVYEGEGKKVEENHLLGFFKITGIPAALKGSPEISVCMDIDASNALTVLAGVVISGTQGPMGPFIEARMPTVDDGHGWCAEALLKMYGSDLDLSVVHKKAQH